MVLVKHPSESREYRFDFSGAAGPGGNRRGDTWSCALADLLSDPESALVNLPALPLFFGQALTTASAAVTATRGDGQPSDLVLGEAHVESAIVVVQVGGGTAGQRYTLTCLANTVHGQTLALVGELVIAEEA